MTRAKPGRLRRAVKAFWAVLRNKRAEPSSLREFVYLDETSVESLLASLDGEILTGITESRTRGYELALSATGEAQGIPAGLNPGIRRSRSVAVEEQRKSVAQSAFARLRNRHYSSLRLQAHDARDTVSTPLRIDASRDVRADSLLRGDLFEIDLMLGASDVFQVKTVINSMIGVVDAFPEQFSTPALAPIRDAEPIAALLDSLSQGLIPIEGEVVGFRLVTVDGVEWVAPDDVARSVVAAGLGMSRPLVVAGVSLEPLYWQDVRRVLFSDLRFRVMGRLVHDGVRDGWSSVKLSDVLSRVNTQLAETIDSLGGTFLSTLQSGAQQDAQVDTTANAMKRQAQLRRFAERVVSEAGLQWTESDENALKKLASELDAAAVTLESWRDALRTLSDEILTRSNNRLEPEALTRLRADYPLPGQDRGDEIPDTNVAPGYLEFEIIAIYW
jgi:hypothetical protein